MQSKRCGFPQLSQFLTNFVEFWSFQEFWKCYEELRKLKTSFTKMSKIGSIEESHIVYSTSLTLCTVQLIFLRLSTKPLPTVCQLNPKPLSTFLRKSKWVTNFALHKNIFPHGSKVFWQRKNIQNKNGDFMHIMSLNVNLKVQSINRYEVATDSTVE